MTFGICILTNFLCVVLNSVSLILKLDVLKYFKMFQRKNIQGENFTPLSMEKDMKNSSSDTELLDFQEKQGWLRSWFPKWVPTSMQALAAAERRILSYVRTPFLSRYVNVGSVVGNEDCKIWTIAMNEKSDKTPLILLHGLGSGVALWCLNLDAFAKNRPVYAFDFLGFGRSSRPVFSADALEAERELVESVEEWRKEMKLEKVVLLGHSMGGFLATSYALQYPERVSSLILADPWGFPEKPADLSSRYPIPLWVKAIAYVLQPLNPLWGIRFVGPLGPKLIEKVRPDLINKFSTLSENEDVKIAEYIFHCNAQNPTGEAAFHSMMSSFGWAKFPMSKRIPQLSKHIPLTMIYGSRSWVDHSPGDYIKQLRTESYVDVQIVQGAGHHVYADKKDNFNDIVLKACAMVDSGYKGPKLPNASTKPTINVENQEVLSPSPSQTFTSSSVLPTSSSTTTTSSPVIAPNLIEKDSVQEKGN